MRKVFNFGAGPAMLPEEVLLEAQTELLDWHGTGMSIMEVGHRSPEFATVTAQAEADVRELMSIPKNYHVLFLSGGASYQFGMVPMNLFGAKKQADYLDTGIWSKKAIAEAKCYGEVNIVAQVKHGDLIYVPPQDQWSLNPNAAYVHYTPNETIEGIEIFETPKTGNVPLVADMTSVILSREIDVSKYGIIYAGAQKNLGPAGITLVIIRDDLIKEPLPGTPTLYSYQLHVEHKSFYNTPPTYNWYIVGLVLAWMKRQGGIKVFAERNKRKAEKLYRYIDEHKDFYFNTIDPKYRSTMNIIFNLKNSDLTDKFLDLAKQARLANLKGHRLAGGVRASIYNAMPEAGIDTLIDFMKDFSKRYG